MNPLILLSARGLYCPRGDFYIDPTRSVDTAVITHAHSDHARKGSRRYLCAQSSVRLLKARLGSSIQVTGIPFGERVRIGTCWVSFHPAGHILGSAQVRVEAGGETWVASGDYKREPDPSCEPFEVVQCDTFITEATFGTPAYSWRRNREKNLNGSDQSEDVISKEILSWWETNAAEGYNSVLFGYSLGKAQRILAELRSGAPRPVLIDPTIAPLAECYREEGISLARTVSLSELPSRYDINGELLLAPPSVLRDEDWARRIGNHRTAFASGWMAQSAWKRGSYDHGFVISDHADWQDLNRTIQETRAKRVFVQHRGTGALVRHLRAQGLDAHPVEVLDETKHAQSRQLPLFE